MKEGPAARRMMKCESARTREREGGREGERVGEREERVGARGMVMERKVGKGLDLKGIEGREKKTQRKGPKKGEGREGEKRKNKKSKMKRE